MLLGEGGERPVGDFPRAEFWMGELPATGGAGIDAPGGGLGAVGPGPRKRREHGGSGGARSDRDGRHVKRCGDVAALRRFVEARLPFGASNAEQRLERGASLIGGKVFEACW